MSGAERVRWEIGAPPRGPNYVRLVEWVSARAATFSVRLYDLEDRGRGLHGSVLAAMAGDGLVVSDDGLEYTAPITPALVAVICEVATEFNDWQGSHLWWDPSFQRDDGSVVLGTATCFNEAWLEIDESELASLSDLRRVLALAPPALPSTTHDPNAWSAAADSVVEAQSPFDPTVFELLPCRRVADDRFEVCCIPFHLSDVALGDEIVAERNAEGRLTLREVSARRGRRVMSVWVRSPDFDARELARRLTDLGAEVEVGADRMLVMDVGSIDHDDDPSGELIWSLEETGDVTTWYS
jgi:hypothetical protein